MDNNDAYEYELSDTTDGYFSIWSEPRAVIAQLNYSLSYLLDCTVERIVAYRQPMINQLKVAIPKLGYPLLTPHDSIGPLVTFECANAKQKLGPAFEAAGIKASLYKGHFRVALSVYNNMNDVELLVQTLKEIN